MIWTQGPMSFCGDCGRFMAVDNDRVFLPHKHVLKDEWCVSPDKHEWLRRNAIDDDNEYRREMFGGDLDWEH